MKTFLLIILFCMGVSNIIKSDETETEALIKFRKYLNENINVWMKTIIDSALDGNILCRETFNKLMREAERDPDMNLNNLITQAHDLHISQKVVQSLVLNDKLRIALILNFDFYEENTIADKNSELSVLFYNAFNSLRPDLREYIERTLTEAVLLQLIIREKVSRQMSGIG